MRTQPGAKSSHLHVAWLQSWRHPPYSNPFGHILGTGQPRGVTPVHLHLHLPSNCFLTFLAFSSHSFEYVTPSSPQTGANTAEHLQGGGGTTTLLQLVETSHLIELHWTTPGAHLMHPSGKGLKSGFLAISQSALAVVALHSFGRSQVGGTTLMLQLVETSHFKVSHSTTLGAHLMQFKGGFFANAILQSALALRSVHPNRAQVGGTTTLLQLVETSHFKVSHSTTLGAHLMQSKGGFFEISQSALAVVAVHLSCGAAKTLVATKRSEGNI